MQSASTSTDHSAVSVKPDTTDTRNSLDGGRMDETVLVSRPFLRWASPSGGQIWFFKSITEIVNLFISVLEHDFFFSQASKFHKDCESFVVTNIFWCEQTLFVYSCDNNTGLNMAYSPKLKVANVFISRNSQNKVVAIKSWFTLSEIRWLCFQMTMSVLCWDAPTQRCVPIPLVPSSVPVKLATYRPPPPPVRVRTVGIPYFHFIGTRKNIEYIRGIEIWRFRFFKGSVVWVSNWLLHSYGI